MLLVAVGLFGSLMIIPKAAGASTLYVGGAGPGNYTTIQSALDSTNPGDTVFVFEGIYNENPVILNTISLVGQGADLVTIKGEQTDDTITVVADQVNISGFTLTGTGGISSGITLNSKNNHVFDNRVEDVIYGITAYGPGNVIENNTLSNNDYGGIRVSAPGNTIKNNTLSRSHRGIDLSSTPRIRVTGNAMTGSGIYVDGLSLDEWNTHTIDTTNTVNGKPVYYWKNVSAGAIPPDAGQVILANCINVRVENLNTSGTSAGIEIGFSSHNVIAGNNISNNAIGIYQRYSHKNLLANNSLYSNVDDGIEWLQSYGDTVTNNVVSDSLFGIVVQVTTSLTMSDNRMFRTGFLFDGWAVNQWNSHEIDTSNIVNGRPVQFWKDSIGGTVPPGAGQVILANCSDVTVSGEYVKQASVGIHLGFSSNNTITNNTFSSNYYGALFESSRDNLFYHNNFIDNEDQQYFGGWNKWDDGYPTGGNFWSDYHGVDYMRGPSQNIPESDGIGDTGYPAQAPFDNYPLMYPYGLPSAPRSLEAKAGNGRVVLTWQAPVSDGGSPITGYSVYRGTVSGGETLLAVLGNVLTYTDTAVTNEQKYYYEVSASNSYGEGPKSIEASATPSTTANPPGEISVFEEPWFWIAVAAVIIALVAVVLLWRRKKAREIIWEPPAPDEEDAGPFGREGDVPAGKPENMPEESPVKEEYGEVGDPGDPIHH